MVIGDASNRVIEYLKKEGPTNTFRLTRALGIDRHKILDIIKELEKKQAIEFRHGVVRFLKFPTEEKKEIERPVKLKTVPSKPKKIVKRKIKAKKPAQGEIKLPEKLEALENLREKNKELKEKILKLKASVKKQSDIKNNLKEQSEYIEKLEKIIKELKQKANASPKTIRKTIIKKIPVKPIKEKVKRKKKPKKKKKIKFKKIKIKFDWFKRVKQLKIPKFIKNRVKKKS